MNYDCYSIRHGSTMKPCLCATKRSNPDNEEVRRKGNINNCQQSYCTDK